MILRERIITDSNIFFVSLSAPGDILGTMGLLKSFVERIVDMSVTIIVLEFRFQPLPKHLQLGEVIRILHPFTIVRETLMT